MRIILELTEAEIKLALTAFAKTRMRCDEVESVRLNYSPSDTSPTGGGPASFSASVHVVQRGSLDVLEKGMP